jgi:hypothetical protein
MTTNLGVGCVRMLSIASQPKTRRSNSAGGVCHRTLSISAVSISVVHGFVVTVVAFVTVPLGQQFHSEVRVCDAPGSVLANCAGSDLV